MTTASYITLLRIVLIIPIIYFASFSEVYLSLFLFIIAGLTDYLDGFIARKTYTTTSLGALLDLLADKLLVCLVLIWCVFLSNSVLKLLFFCQKFCHFSSTVLKLYLSTKVFKNKNVYSFFSRIPAFFLPSFS